MNMKNLSNEILDVIDKFDFVCSEVEEQDEEFYVELSQYTPAGEDWREIIWFNGTDVDFVKDLRNRIADFDIDEEVEKWIPSRGQNGVPEKISDLLEDAEWKLEKLEDLCNELECTVFEMNKKTTVEITMEKTMRVCMTIEVTKEQLGHLKTGYNPFYDDADFENGNIEYDYAVCDEDGKEIVPWSD